MADNSSIDFNARAQPGMNTVVASNPPAPDIELDDYISELMECGLSRKQSEDYLATLVPLLWHFADLGFRGDISELLLSWADSVAVESNEEPKKKVPFEAESEVAAE